MIDTAKETLKCLFLCVLFSLQINIIQIEFTIANMYHSVSETSHPLQTEEQEIGIDPLQSYLNKPGEGEFCISVLF